MSLLVICEILEHFVNTLTADDKHSLCNSELLLQPIQMQLSKKENFFRIFCSISGMYINFLTLKKKDYPHSLYTSEISESERRV